MTLVDGHTVQRPADLERGIPVDYGADTRYGIAPIHSLVGHFERGNAWRYCRRDNNARWIGRTYRCTRIVRWKKKYATVVNMDIRRDNYRTP